MRQAYKVNETCKGPRIFKMFMQDFKLLKFGNNQIKRQTLRKF